MPEDGVGGEVERQVLADDRICGEIPRGYRRTIGFFHRFDATLHLQSGGTGFARGADGDGDFMGEGDGLHGGHPGGDPVHARADGRTISDDVPASIARRMYVPKGHQMQGGGIHLNIAFHPVFFTQERSLSWQVYSG